jgi:DNA-binding NtrC family response regulator
MILVVDDDRTQTELLKELLEGEGYEVRTAGNAADAYLQLKDPKCKGVVLAMQMPGINGTELLMLMAADGIRVPVLLTTSDPGFDESEMKQFPNVRKLFQKPLYPEDIVAALRQYAEKPTGPRRAAQ